MFLRPPDGPDVCYEFFGPFAHVPGQYEWCRIRSPTHGVLDCFIVLGSSTSVPATVYVGSDEGEAFMRDRYPECTYLRATEMEIGESRQGRTVQGRMASDQGPVRRVDLVIEGDDGVPTQTPYGGDGASVWGSERFTCWGVDLTLPGRVKGHVEGPNGRLDLNGQEGVVTLGSFARIAALPNP